MSKDTQVHRCTILQRLCCYNLVSAAMPARAPVLPCTWIGLHDHVGIYGADGHISMFLGLSILLFWFLFPPFFFFSPLLPSPLHTPEHLRRLLYTCSTALFSFELERMCTVVSSNRALLRM